MVNHAVPRAPLRRLLGGFVIAALAGVAGAACRAEPPDMSVRSITPSGSSTAPSGAEVAQRDRALLRVVAAIPGASRLDLFLDGQKLFDGLEYHTITPFREVPSGRQALRLRPAGLDTADPLTAENEHLRAGRYYTAVIMPGEDAGPAAVLRVFDDPMDLPQQDRARLRVVHAAADAGRLDVHIPGRQDPLAGGLEFQRASEFAELAPAPVPLELRPAQRTETMLRLSDLRLSGGGLYTVVLIGRARTDPPLETLVIEDRSAGRSER